VLILTTVMCKPKLNEKPINKEQTYPDGADIPKKRLRKIARICNPCPQRKSTILIRFLHYTLSFCLLCRYTAWARIANPRYRTQVYIIHIQNVGVATFRKICKQRKMENIITRRITLDDLEKLQKIGRKTFEETFSESNSKENMRSYLDEGFSKEKLTAELNNKDSEFYFAILKDEVIGYLKVNFGESQTELKDSKALEIERIYVSKEFHGKSVGQLLYDKAIQIAKQKDSEYVWLGVWEENPRAIGFYKKNGFVEFDKHIFRLGDDEQTDIMMKLKLE
jgi:ribosomal protein S18 acetylase RimI-like enzyme